MAPWNLINYTIFSDTASYVNKVKMVENNADWIFSKSISYLYLEFFQGEPIWAANIGMASK